jgi:hypothetical protein
MIYVLFWALHAFLGLMREGLGILFSALVRSVLIPVITCSRYRRGWCRVERIEIDLSDLDAAAANQLPNAQQQTQHPPQGGLGLSLAPTGKVLSHRQVGSAAVRIAVKIASIKGAGPTTSTSRSKARLRINDVIIGVNGNSLLPVGGLPLGSFDALQLVRQAVARAETEADEERELRQQIEEEHGGESERMVMPIVTPEALLEFYEARAPGTKTMAECKNFCTLKQQDLQKALLSKYGQLPTLVEGAPPRTQTAPPVGVLLPFMTSAPSSASARCDDNAQEAGVAQSDGGFLLTAEALLRFYLIADPAKVGNVKGILNTFAGNGKELRTRLLHKYGAAKLLEGLLPPSACHNQARRKLCRAIVSPDMPLEGKDQEQYECVSSGAVASASGALVVREGISVRKRGSVVLDVFRGQSGHRNCCFCLFPLRWVQMMLDTTGKGGSGEVTNRSAVPVSTPHPHLATDHSPRYSPRHLPFTRHIHSPQSLTYSLTHSLFHAGRQLRRPILSGAELQD